MSRPIATFSVSLVGSAVVASDAPSVPAGVRGGEWTSRTRGPKRGEGLLVELCVCCRLAFRDSSSWEGVLETVISIILDSERRGGVVRSATKVKDMLTVTSRSGYICEGGGRQFNPGKRRNRSGYYNNKDICQRAVVSNIPWKQVKNMARKRRYSFFVLVVDGPAWTLTIP